MTSTFDYYELEHKEQGVDGGFVYEKVPHITLKSIAQNPKIDEVSEKDPKRREKIEKIIQEGAEQETLYDRPLIDRKKVRVSGPFTVESIPTPSLEDPGKSAIDQYEECLDPDARKDDIARRGRGAVAGGSGNFLLDMIDALKTTGIVNLQGGRLRFNKLNLCQSAGVIQAEGELEDSKGKVFGISFGPQYGPVTISQVEQALQEARGRYDGVVFIGFTFEAEAQEFLKRDLPVTLMGAFINPDVLVGDLLKTSKGSQLFTMFGQTDIRVDETKKGWVVEVRGVDVYDPNTGEVKSDRGQEIAAWFLDVDYDDRCFNVCQAFFPGGGNNPWEKLSRALRGTVNEEVFETLRGLKSYPFGPPDRDAKEKTKPWKIAVKVIDHRGLEMLEVREMGKV